MRKSCTATLAALACLFLCAPSKAADNIDLSGTWSGTYVCAQGQTGLTLTFAHSKTGQHSGTFDFFPLPSNPQAKKGRYEILAKPDGRGGIIVTAGGWLLRPSGYLPVGLRGTVDEGGRVFRGQADSGCKTFSVVRDIAPNPSVAENGREGAPKEEQAPSPAAPPVKAEPTTAAPVPALKSASDTPPEGQKANTKEASIASTSDDRSPILIGISGPFSLQPDYFEQQMKAGAEMAAAAINESGGAIGRPIKLVFGDDKNDPRAAIDLANRFIADGVSFVIGAPTSGPALASSEIYQENGVVMMTPMAPAPDYTERNLWNVFRVWNRRDRQGAVAGRYIADHFTAPRVLLVSDDSKDGTAISNVAKWNLNASGINEIAAVQVDASTEDFSAFVSNMKNDGITVVHYSGDYRGAGAIMREMAAQRLDAQFVGTDLMFDEGLVNAAGPGLQDALFTMDSDSVGGASSQAVAARFRDADIKPNVLALTTHAAVETIARAITLAGSVNSYSVAEILKQNKVFETAIGSISFDQKGDLSRSYYSMYRWQKNGDGRMDYAVVPAEPAEKIKTTTCLATIRAVLKTLSKENVENCRAALLIDPQSPRLQLALGRTLMNNGGSAEAAKLFFKAASEGDDAAAAYHYSLLLEWGEGLPKDLKKAAEIRQIAANFGHSQAEFRIGRDLVRVKDKKGVDWLAKAAQKGHILASYELSRLYDKGELVEKDIAVEREFLEKAASGGNMTAEFLLGLYHQIGSGVDKDLYRSTELFRRAAVQGVAAAEYEMGDARYYGYGIEKDTKLAVMWFERAVAQNDKRAQLALSHMFAAGEGGLTVDKKKSFELAQASANQGYPNAFWFTGGNYEFGIGTDKDLKTAYIWYEKAANAGYANAMYKMGLAEYRLRRVRTPEQVGGGDVECGHQGPQIVEGWLARPRLEM